MDVFLILYVLGLMVMFFFLGAAIGGAARSFKAYFFGIKDNEYFCCVAPSARDSALIKASPIAGAALGTAGLMQGAAEEEASEGLIEVQSEEPSVDRVAEWNETEAEPEVVVDQTVAVQRDEQAVVDEAWDGGDTAQPRVLDEDVRKDADVYRDENGALRADQEQAIVATPVEETPVVEPAKVAIAPQQYEFVPIMLPETPEEPEAPEEAVEQGEPEELEASVEHVDAPQEQAGEPGEELGPQVWDYAAEEDDYSDVMFDSAGVEDDLTLIKGIDAELKGGLNELGVRSFEQIATLNSREVGFLQSKLGFTSELNEAGWIEQAKILAAGGITAFAGSMMGQEQSGTAETIEQPQIVGADVEQGSVVQEPDAPDAVETAEAEDLAARETSDERELEAEQEGDNGRDKRLFGERERQERDNGWRERYSGERKVVPPGERLSTELSDSEELDEASYHARRVDSDDLKQIRYISTGLEKKLNLLGVYKLSQIAQWSDEEIADVSEQLELKDRINEEGWIAQAAEAMISDGEGISGDDRMNEGFEPASVVEMEHIDQIVDLTDNEKTLLVNNGVTNINQIANWSGADIKWAGDLLEVGDLERVSSWVETARALVSSEVVDAPGGVASGADQDLKRIRGIDAETEEKLKTLGVSTYEQIANFEQKDINRVNEWLGISGRVEREYWVVQAKVLRDGGDTDFSKLYDGSAEG